jgi:hypothetical protein
MARPEHCASLNDAVGELDVRRVSWSVTLRGQDPAVLDDAFGGLVETCAHALGERFPPGSGYETRSFQLSGPLEGTRLEVQRGRFTGLVSAQRYRRCHGAGLRRGDPVEVRLVASTKIAPRPKTAGCRH